MKLEKSSSTIFYIKFISLSFLIISFISVALLALFTFIFVRTKTLPVELIKNISFFLILASSLLGSLLTARIAKSKGLILGLFSGAIFFILLFLLSYINLHEVNLPILLIRGFAIIVASSIGGIIGVNKNKKRRKV